MQVYVFMYRYILYIALCFIGITMQSTFAHGQTVSGIARVIICSENCELESNSPVSPTREQTFSGGRGNGDTTPPKFLYLLEKNVDVFVERINQSQAQVIWQTDELTRYEIKLLLQDNEEQYSKGRSYKKEHVLLIQQLPVKKEYPFTLFIFDTQGNKLTYEGVIPAYRIFSQESISNKPEPPATQPNLPKEDASFSQPSQKPPSVFSFSPTPTTEIIQNERAPSSTTSSSLHTPIELLDMDIISIITTTIQRPKSVLFSFETVPVDTNISQSNTIKINSLVSNFFQKLGEIEWNILLIVPLFTQVLTLLSSTLLLFLLLAI